MTPEPREIVAAYKDGLRLCTPCQVWFAPARKDQLHCSERCRKRAQRMASPPA